MRKSELSPPQDIQEWRGVVIAVLVIVVTLLILPWRHW
jgi:hypothetical protein